MPTKNARVFLYFFIIFFKFFSYMSFSSFVGHVLPKKHLAASCEALILIFLFSKPNHKYDTDHYKNYGCKDKISQHSAVVRYRCIL